VFFHNFASWSPTSLLTLAGMAQPDEWEYRHTASERPLPILRNYIVYTFRQAYLQRRVLEVADVDNRRYAAFNTGLLTPHYERIFGLFIQQTRQELPQPWFLQDFVRESDYRLMRFQKLPEKATYFDDPSDLLYDPRLDLRVQYEHIVNDRLERFPKDLQTDERRRTEALRQAVAHAVFRVEQNYKTAIPQFHWNLRDEKEPGKLQLLLPLCLEDVGRADLALSIDKMNGVYRAATVLTLDMAYNNARLIARPDKEWLEPLPGARRDDSDEAEPQEANRSSTTAES
jgi:hypothetical protein